MSSSEIRERCEASIQLPGFAELVIGPAPSGGTRWLNPGYNALCARARAAAVRVATRSSSAIMSSTSARSKPCGDEDDLAAAIRIRPAVEPRQIVEEMLRALDHRRAIGLFGDINDALHPQEVRPEILLKRIEQKPQRFARDRRITREAERGDVAIVQMVVIVIFVIMAVTVMPMIVMMMRIGLHRRRRR